MNIETKIRQLREQKGYSQEYMAEMLKISQKTYSNIETGKSELKFTMIEKISGILEVPFMKLLPDRLTE